MKKTALQSAIEEILSMPNYSPVEYRLRNKIIKLLESKLPQEKQDLIMSHYVGVLAVFLVLILASLIELNKN